MEISQDPVVACKCDGEHYKSPAISLLGDMLRLSLATSVWNLQCHSLVCFFCLYGERSCSTGKTNDDGGSAEVAVESPAG
ncbi:hypothetical protein GN958_ATG09363 [Phytophthora infestans]|uniref:Uncharacterized protein n=1 Tax=Phytophthora infestans TaxID=4787 RepID=A0A8S9UPQ8_PHYIN|nr:hypothetical protein GN958_ATG09363 [Phytophthora infestans]